MLNVFIGLNRCCSVKDRINNLVVNSATVVTKDNNNEPVVIFQTYNKTTPVTLN